MWRKVVNLMQIALQSSDESTSKEHCFEEVFRIICDVLTSRPDASEISQISFLNGHNKSITLISIARLLVPFFPSLLATMSYDGQCLSRNLLESELLKYNDPPKASVPYNDRDRRLVSAYRSYVRFNVIKQKREFLLDEDIFSTLAKYLCASPQLSYEDFKVISSVAPPSANKYFTAKCFLMFPQDDNQRINSEDFVRYRNVNANFHLHILNFAFHIYWCNG